MENDVKLYKHFVDQIGKLGRIKRAWFTTFNLDISFFEKYILSALVGRSYQDLKTPYDYEAINDYLANEQESLDEDKIDVKVFYDFRVLKITGKPKQTSVHLYPIDTKLLGGLNDGVSFEYGVFHPKVILLESFAGEYWLMVSSANLTFGGWSKNRECFFCEKIENTYIARNLGIFFSGIIGSIRGFEENPLLVKLNSGKFGQENCRWDFYSSFNNGSFLQQLASKTDLLPLRVWSPYFADDLPLMVNELQEKGFDTIEIIPAKNENQKIRITEKGYKESLNLNGVTFKQDKSIPVNQEAFVHAKVWLTPKSLAIGSWNMTFSGINESTKGNNNVEAGIIYELSPKEYQAVLDDYSLAPLRAIKHYTEDELESEKEEILDVFTLVVDIVADWDKMQLILLSPTFTKLNNQLKGSGAISLPGFGKVGIQSLNDKIDFRRFSRSFLSDRFFEIEDKNGKVVYKGYIREVGLSSRPINSFQNIDDYLKGWVLERPEEKEELHRLSYPVEEETGDEFSNETRKILLSSDQNAWFTSFHAFESIINRINQCRELYAKDKLAELKRIGRILPGSLTELRSHLDNLKILFLENRDNFAKSPIYLWFLIEKANYVFSYFNKEINLPIENIAKIKNIKFENLFTKKEIDTIGFVNIERWKSYLINKLKNQ